MTDTQVLLRGLQFGEGPRWRDGLLWFSDFYRHGIFTVDSNGNEQRIHDVPTQSSGLGWLPNGDLLFVSMLDRTLRRLTPAGEEQIHADLNAVAAGPCNDMVVSANGTAYVGNFGFDDKEGEVFKQATLAIVSPTGEVTAGPSELDFPNGTVIDPAGRLMVMAETYGHRLTAFDIADDGTLANRRIFAELGERIPDGICLDENGGIWVADPLNACCFRVIAGGEITDEIELELNCFACMLGGDDRRTLYMITAPTSRPEKGAAPQGRIETARVEFAGAGLP